MPGYTGLGRTGSRPGNWRHRAELCDV